jgi:hypothetical protein
MTARIGLYGNCGYEIVARFGYKCRGARRYGWHAKGGSEPTERTPGKRRYPLAGSFCVQGRKDDNEPDAHVADPSVLSIASGKHSLNTAAPLNGAGLI